MKNNFFTAVIIFIVVILPHFASAQSPNKMSYQAVIRNSSNNLVINSIIGMRISILQGSVTGTAMYVETQTPSSNLNGLISIEIGNGSVVSGSITTIDWSAGPYFIKTEIDPAGSTSYSITSTNQLLSVPYALYAERSGSLTHSYVAGQGISINGDTIKNSSLNTDNQTLYKNGDTLFISNGNYVLIPGLSNPNNGFSCGGNWTDTRDGQVYSTVQIGTQCWMRENLNIGTKIIGSIDQTNNSIIEKYCFNNDTANSSIYGGLYQWGEVVDYYNGASNTTTWSQAPNGNLQGICPCGWHIPTDVEWTTLSNQLGGQNVAGGKMKEAGTLHWNTANGTNLSNFTGLPAGFRNYNGPFLNLRSYTYYWSATNTASEAYNVRLYDSDTNLFPWSTTQKTSGYSVRCIKD